MKKNLLPFLIKLLLISLVLGFLWFWKLQNLYPRLLWPVAVPFFQWVGVKKWLLSWVLNHFANIVPYLALVLATPRVLNNRKKLLAAILGGLLVLAIMHLFLSWMVYHYYEQYQFTKSFFRRTFPFFLINDALPLPLWLVFYPRIHKELFGFIFKKKVAEDPK
jgi:hypothetical protein